MKNKLILLLISIGLILFYSCESEGQFTGSDLEPEQDKYIEIELIIAFIDIITNGINNNINNENFLKMMHNAKCCLLANYEGKVSYIKNENIYVNYDKLRNKNIYLSYLNSVKQNLE